MIETKKYAFDKIKLLLVAVIVILLGLLTKECDPQQPETNTLKDSLKTVIKNQLQIVDSLKGVANKNDSVRIEYITQWRTKIKTIIQHDSIPCDSILPIVVSTCDSIISKDSIYISNLKNIIKADSIVINTQNKVMVLDSVTIANLEKDVKKLKRHRKWLLGSTGVFAGLFILTNR